jgi:hypothetical protein
MHPQSVSHSGPQGKAYLCCQHPDALSVPALAPARARTERNSSPAAPFEALRARALPRPNPHPDPLCLFLRPHPPVRRGGPSVRTILRIGAGWIRGRSACGAAQEFARRGRGYRIAAGVSDTDEDREGVNYGATLCWGHGELWLWLWFSSVCFVVGVRKKTRGDDARRVGLEDNG